MASDSPIFSTDEDIVEILKYIYWKVVSVSLFPFCVGSTNYKYLLFKNKYMMK